MHVKSLSQGLSADLDSNPEPPDPKAKCLPLDYDATTPASAVGQVGTKLNATVQHV